MRERSRRGKTNRQTGERGWGGKERDRGKDRERGKEKETSERELWK